MRIVFRADASYEIGSGHVMRSSVLAQEAISRGYECIFLGSVQDLSWVSDRLSILGFKAIINNPDSFIPDRLSDVLVIDSYTIPTSSNILKSDSWRKIVSISDDLTPNYSVDMKIVPSFESITDFAKGQKVLSGPDHLLIRSEIYKTSSDHIESDPLKILVVGGGSDPFGFCPEISRILDTFSLPLEVHYFSHSEFESSSGKTYISHEIGSQLDSLANEFDLAVTTASTLSLEFIAREIPIAVAAVVDNQIKYYEELGARNLAQQIGYRTKLGEWQLNHSNLNKVIESDTLRKSLKLNMNGLVDLKGAFRVIDQIEKLVKE